MPNQSRSRFQFRLRDVFVLILGIALGYSVNLTVQLLRDGPRPASITRFPPYVIEPPDILTIDAKGAFSDKWPSVAGQHLVGMDGFVNLGPHGSVYVAGLTLADAQQAVHTAIGRNVTLESVAVDVFAYNSKTFYVVTQSPGGDHVVEAPITGNETVLDAVAQVGGVSQISRMWISRPAPNGGKEKILPVAWEEISAGKSTATNYQLWPRDRLHIDTRSAARKPTE